MGEEDNALFVEALYAAGVDSWSGFEEAMKLYNTWLLEKDSNEG